MTADFVGDKNLHPVNSTLYELSTLPMKLCVPLFTSPACGSKEAPCCLSAVGFLPAPTRTGQAPLSASGGPTPAAYAFSHDTSPSVPDSILLSLRISPCPEFLGPLPLCPAFPDSLDGRDPVEYYGPALPARSIGDLSTYPFREALAASSVARLAISPYALGALP